MRNAIKAKGGGVPTTEEVKKGMEAIKGLNLGGLVPPRERSAADNEGGGWCQVWTGRGGQTGQARAGVQGWRGGARNGCGAVGVGGARIAGKGP